MASRSGLQETIDSRLFNETRASAQPHAQAHAFHALDLSRARTLKPHDDENEDNDSEFEAFDEELDFD